jgi:hypothetical protein
MMLNQAHLLDSLSSMSKTWTFRRHRSWHVSCSVVNKNKCNRIITAVIQKDFSTNRTIKGTLDVRLPYYETRQPVSFSEPRINETEEVKALRRVLELPLSSYILSQPIPSGWRIRRTKDKDWDKCGFYFLHPKTKNPTAILWYDPDDVVGDENFDPTEDVLGRLQPIRYHFPEAFHVDEEGGNAVETSSMVTDHRHDTKRIVLE